MTVCVNIRRRHTPQRCPELGVLPPPDLHSRETGTGQHIPAHLTQSIFNDM